MNNLTPIDKAEQSRAAARQPRISAKLRKAIELLEREYMTQRQAAKLAGITESNLSIALKKPHVAEHREKEKAKAIKDFQDLRANAKPQAYKVGLELMHNAKSESVKARMVEFFASESKKSVENQVNVAIAVGGQGYEFAPHGAQVVEINPDQGASDMVSEADAAQPAEIKEE